jgi:hypothetical protein
MPNKYALDGDEPPRAGDLIFTVRLRPNENYGEGTPEHREYMAAYFASQMNAFINLRPMANYVKASTAQIRVAKS